MRKTINAIKLLLGFPKFLLDSMDGHGKKEKRVSSRGTPMWAKDVKDLEERGKEIMKRI